MSVDEAPERLVNLRREQVHPNRRPVDAATLVLIDPSGRKPRVLLGLRHARQKFAPAKFVFPGGRVDPADRRMPVFGALDAESERRLEARVVRPSLSRSRALALAAIRETFEETGLLLGTREAGSPPLALPPGWEGFGTAGVFPNLEALRFVARAITPPRLVRRFDTRFFMADVRDVAHEVKGVVGPDSELTELRWLTLEEAKAADILTITRTILGEVEQRLAPGGYRRPVPFYYMRGGAFRCDTLD
jgi:8-oxo-dGTP pyrophosphatase MutT (NUDIX family)